VVLNPFFFCLPELVVLFSLSSQDHQGRGRGEGGGWKTCMRLGVEV